MSDQGLIDDPTIPHDAVLWRRIYPENGYIAPRENGELRATSLAFDDSSDGSPMSMYLADEAGDPSVALRGHENFGLASLKAQDLRNEGQAIARDDADIPGHVLVDGPKPASVRKRWARQAILVLPTVIAPQQR